MAVSIKGLGYFQCVNDENESTSYDENYALGVPYEIAEKLNGCY